MQSEIARGNLATFRTFSKKAGERIDKPTILNASTIVEVCSANTLWKQLHNIKVAQTLSRG